MLRVFAIVAATALVALVAYGCTSMVPLSEGYFPAQVDTGEVQIIDARTMERSRIEAVLSEHSLIGRFDVSIPGGESFEQRLKDEVEKSKARVLKSGGRVLMYTDNSELIAVIERDARYAGASNAITMYIMLRRP